MPAPRYDDYELSIEPVEGGRYRVRVLDSTAGPGSAVIDWPFSDLELENTILKLRQARKGTRRIGSPEERFAQEFGQRLFSTVFPDEIRQLYVRSLEDARRTGKAGLRLRIRFGNASELIDVPWEYLYCDEPAARRFLARSAETPIVRYLELGRAYPPLALNRPLRALVAISRPPELATLEAEEEFASLTAALREPMAKDHILVDRLEPPTISQLQQSLLRGKYHIFHFIGHGEFDEGSGEGSLSFEDDHGHSYQVSSSQLEVALRDYHKHLRLVILNSCEGARTTRADPFGGTAQGLISQGIPAVVAMQFEITNQASISFSRGFYTALAAGLPVDQAVSEGRKAIYIEGNDIEWGTPCLYTQVRDSTVFQLPTLVPDLRAKTQAAAVTTLADVDLALGPLVEQGDEAVPAGRVIRSDPPADAEVPDHGAVSLIVSTGPTQAAAPEPSRSSQPTEVTVPIPDPTPVARWSETTPIEPVVAAPQVVGLDRDDAIGQPADEDLAATPAPRVGRDWWHLSASQTIIAVGAVAAVLVIAAVLLWGEQDPWCPQGWLSLTGSENATCQE